MSRLFFGTTLVVCLACADAHAAEVFYLGSLTDPDDPFGTQINAVSADGSTVVGSTVGPLGQEAFRWTADEGMVGLGDLLGGSFRSVAFGVNADGSVIVGRGSALSFSSPSGVDRAFRWEAGSEMRQLAAQESNVSTNTATRVSRDGTTVFGSGTRLTGPGMLQNESIEFRWTEATDAVASDALLPDYDWAFPVSPNEDLWAAYEDFPVAMRRYSLLDLSGETPQVVQQFAPFPTNVSPPPAGVEYPVAATDDGTIVFGRRLLPDPANEGETVQSIFAEAAGERTTIVTAHNGISIAGATDDGGVLLGHADFAAFVWTAAGGLRPLNEFFVNDHGLEEFSDWLPNFFGMRMSADAMVFAGQGTDADLNDHRVVVRLSDRLPGDANFDGCVDLADFSLLKADFNTGLWWNQGNFDGDRDVDLDDFAILKEHFGAKSSPVPEPSTGVLALLGGALTRLFRRRRRRRRRHGGDASGHPKNAAMAMRISAGSSLHGPQDGDQDDGADRGGDQLAEQTDRRKAEQAEHEAAYDRADDSDDEISDEAVTAPLGYLTGEPTRGQSDH